MRDLETISAEWDEVVAAIEHAQVTSGYRPHDLHQRLMALCKEQNALYREEMAKIMPAEWVAELDEILAEKPA